MQITLNSLDIFSFNFIYYPQVHFNCLYLLEIHSIFIQFNIKNLPNLHHIWINFEILINLNRVIIFFARRLILTFAVFIAIFILTHL